MGSPEDIDRDLDSLSGILQTAIDMLMFSEDTYTCMASVCDPIIASLREAQAKVAALRLRLEAMRNG
jgi:hypothetical protein